MICVYYWMFHLPGMKIPFKTFPNNLAKLMQKKKQTISEMHTVKWKHEFHFESEWDREKKQI